MKRKTAVSWIAFGLVTAFAALIWFLDNEALLRSTRPEWAWLTVGIMWIEISGQCISLFWRYLHRVSSLVLPLGIAFASLALNFVGALMLSPAFALA
jgi:hypothetical protein